MSKTPSRVRLADWFSGFVSPRRTVAARKGSAFRPQVCLLEDRLVPATFTVTNANDSGAGSLRQAVADANASAGVPDLIAFDAAFFAAPRVITLTTGALQVSDPLTITGPGADLLTVSGNNAGRVFNVSDGTAAQVAATISGLTATGGKAPGLPGAGIAVGQNDALTLDRVTVSGNTATGVEGGGIGVESGGQLTVTNSTVSGNAANFGGGISFVFGGQLTVTNSTVSGNAATVRGGGMYLDGVAATISNSTIAFNQAGLDSGGISRTIAGSLTLASTILAKNSAPDGPDLRNFTGTATNTANSFIGDPTGGGTITGSPLTGDPLLAPLGDYGGPTKTHALLPGSPALDAANTGAAPATDQRGLGRVGTVDIGAFESQGFVLTVVGGDGQSAVVNTAFADPLVVRVTANNPAEPVDGGRVTFTPPASGASAALATPLATIAGGVAQTAATANGTTGSYSVIATTAGSINPVAIALTNVPENRPPVVEDQFFRVGLILARPGKVVGTVQATDPDPGDVLTYEIVGGNSTLLGAAFTIDPRTGTIRVANTLALGLGLVGGFDLVVRVTDADGLSDTAVIHIDVTLL